MTTSVLDGVTAGVWVDLDVLMQALSITSTRRAYEVIAAEGIRSTPFRPRQYNLDDIARVFRARKEPT